MQRVLYVEDDPSIQLVARLALEEVGGLQVMVCSSGQEALACAAEFRPELLLLDVMMPGLDGPSTLQALRNLEQTRHTPAVFITAKVQPEEIEALERLDGAIGVIAKPFDPLTLASQLQDIWSRHQR